MSAVEILILIVQNKTTMQSGQNQHYFIQGLDTVPEGNETNNIWNENSGPNVSNVLSYLKYRLSFQVICPEQSLYRKQGLRSEVQLLAIVLPCSPAPVDACH